MAALRHVLPVPDIAKIAMKEFWKRFAKNGTNKISVTHAEIISRQNHLFSSDSGAQPAPVVRSQLLKLERAGSESPPGADDKAEQEERPRCTAGA
ncbi:hypothetical protein [Polaromonas sp. C04]|uniref:hypothetical protein n=1 Tax=Polaromonas sp. C04 TaxID=1945857 RepID=UPI001184F920|nr:hypothetical protein [Polaromonas sp. C04]